MTSNNLFVLGLTYSPNIMKYMGTLTIKLITISLSNTQFKKAIMIVRVADIVFIGEKLTKLKGILVRGKSRGTSKILFWFKIGIIKIWYYYFPNEVYSLFNSKKKRMLGSKLQKTLWI